MIRNFLAFLVLVGCQEQPRKNLCHFTPPITRLEVAPGESTTIAFSLISPDGCDRLTKAVCASGDIIIYNASNSLGIPSRRCFSSIGGVYEITLHDSELGASNIVEVEDVSNPPQWLPIQFHILRNSES